MDMLWSLLQLIRPLSDGDLADRLNYCYTSALLVLFSVFISGWSFVGQPIQCWFPAYYKGWWNEYALDYCYVQNTYFLPFTQERSDNYWQFASNLVHIPQNITSREDKLIGYYQWVPFLLAIEAILFYLPVVIWRGMYEMSGIKVKAICDTCSWKSGDERQKQNSLDTIAKFLSCPKRCLGGRYVTSLYLLVKLIFAANCLAQLFILQAFLGLANSWWGIDMISNLIVGNQWPDTGHFPRVTLCDFQVRVLGNLHRHTVQCVLMINMFNEKIFLFLWWWLFIVAICSVVSLFYWLISCVTVGHGHRVIRDYLRKIEPDRTRLDRLSGPFLTEYLAADGVFLLRLLAANSAHLTVSQLLSRLWRHFLLIHPSQPPPYFQHEDKLPLIDSPAPPKHPSVDISQSSL